MSAAGDPVSLTSSRSRSLQCIRRWSLALCVSGVGLLSAGVFAPAQAATLEGQRFDDTLVLADRTLRLNGLGLRGVAWVKAFVAGLYLSAPTKDTAQALAMPGPKRIRLQVMLDAPSKELTRSLIKRVHKHEPAEVQQRLESRLTTLATHLDGVGDLKVGDTLDLDYVPGRGVLLQHNDRPVGTAIPGEDLYRAVMKIFVGDNPVDARMKQGMMRGGV